jgi:hypothetical protein
MFWPWLALRADVAGLHDAADRGEDARDDEHAEHDALHADARRPGRVRVAADGVQGASDPVVLQDKTGDREGDRGEPHRQRHGEEGGGGQRVEAVGHAEERLALGRPDQQAPQHDQHRQRDDERVELELHDQDAVEGADGRARDQDRDQGQGGGEFGAPAGLGGGQHEQRSDGGRDTDDRFQGQVELAGDEDERLGEHDHREGGGGAEDRDQVALGEERVVDDRAEHHQ